FRDEADDKEEDEDEDEDEDDNEEEEHLALADSIQPPPVHCIIARIYQRVATYTSLV
nr:hypothetical protein [Tanacetum cinerariifolium]